MSMVVKFLFFYERTSLADINMFKVNTKTLKKVWNMFNVSKKDTRMTLMKTSFLCLCCLNRFNTFLKVFYGFFEHVSVARFLWFTSLLVSKTLVNEVLFPSFQVPNAHVKQQDYWWKHEIKIKFLSQ